MGEKDIKEVYKSLRTPLFLGLFFLFLIENFIELNAVAKQMFDTIFLFGILLSLFNEIMILKS